MVFHLLVLSSKKQTKKFLGSNRNVFISLPIFVNSQLFSLFIFHLIQDMHIAYFGAGQSGAFDF